MEGLLKVRPVFSQQTWPLRHSCSRQSWQSWKGRRAIRTQTRTRSYATVTAASERDIYDVVCVGGGPAGLSLLTALRSNPATSSLRLALVEAQDLKKVHTWTLPPSEFSNRCSSLTSSSARFLNTIGAWSHMDRSRVQEYHDMQVWDGVSGQQIGFDSVGAYMTENLNLTSGLMKRLTELGGVSIFDSSAVSDISLGTTTSDGYDLTQWPVVSLKDGTTPLTARLLVGADGGNSPVRHFADIESRGWDYNRHGVVATLQLDRSIWGDVDIDGGVAGPPKTAYQRFLPTGPVAMLPLPGPFASLVWTTTPTHAGHLKSLSPPDFVAMINAAFQLTPVELDYMHTLSSGQEDEFIWRQSHTTNPPPTSTPPPVVLRTQPHTTASFPLKLRHADTYIGQRIALIGDAAHTIHPLAGQGLNAGQGDVHALSDAIEHAVLHGWDIGSSFALERYNAERYLANHVLLGVCDKLHKLYSVGTGPLVPLRSLGLGVVNALGPVKTFLMNQAGGGAATKWF